jgi:hypothetical protein
VGRRSPRCWPCSGWWSCAATWRFASAPTADSVEIWTRRRLVRLDSDVLKTFLSLLILLGATGAQAQSLEILGPSGAVAPDGFSVAVRALGAEGVARPASPQVTAEGAEVRPGPAQPPLATYWVVPRPGARQVRLRAVEGALSAEAGFAVGPPSARVELAITPAQPVKGRDTRAELSIRMLRPDGSPDPEASPPVLRSNVGTVAEVQPVSPGVFRASYQLPATRYPEVAIIVALSPWPSPQSIYGSLGRLLVPLAGSVELPGKTERNAEISMEIAGETFGPVRAGPDGRFRLPVVVPPGHKYAVSTAVDRHRNKRRNRVDLALPPTDRLACVANPARLPADGVSQARILCAASDPYGKPQASNKVQLSAQRGELMGPRVLENEMLEWIYTAPRGQYGEPDELLATWKQGGPRSRDELKLELAQGPAAALELTAKEALVHAAGELRLEAAVADALGKPRAGATLRLAVPEGPVTVEETAPGRFSATWQVPDALRGRVTLRGRALGPTGTEPARIGAWLEQGLLRAVVVDLTGLPVPAQRLLVNGREQVTDALGELTVGPAVPGRVALVHAQWPGLRQDVYVLEEGSGMFPAPFQSGSPVREVPVEVAAPAKVLIRFQARPGGVLWWLENDKGRRLEGRKVEVAVSGDARGTPQVSSREPTPVLVRGPRPVTVTVLDLETGFSGIFEVTP